MLGINLESVDPSYNLAVEEVLFDSLSEENPAYFILWQNSPSVIVGRHQNTSEEVNESYVKQENIPVIRRMTGGGAVYHDLGNLNFSFLSFKKNNEEISFADYLKPIVQALQNLGINAEISGRNDMTIDGKKFSGSAKRQNGKKVLVHGTLLISLDMSNLGNILTGNPDKYKSKGIASHRSRVVNLIEFKPNVRPEDLMQEIKLALFAKCTDNYMELPNDLQEKANHLTEKKYKTWEWNFGKSPQYTVRFREKFSWGALDFSAQINKGSIQFCRFYGDFFTNFEIEELENALINLPYNAKSLASFFEKNNKDYFLGAKKEDLINFFKENVL